MGIEVIILFSVLFLALAIGVHIGIALALSGWVLLLVFRDIPLEILFPQYIWKLLTTSELLALPLFILMGEILFRTRISKNLFDGLSPWAELLPGKLLHVNIVGCSIFAAISGSSAATTQVVGKINLKELLARGYSRKIAIGSLAGAGTLGFLIPPSNILIIYGVLAEVSILELFSAGIIPGVTLAILFGGWIAIHTTLNRKLIPAADSDIISLSFLGRLKATKDLFPVMFLIICVLGSMYGGFATPSEAAAVGVLGAAVVAGMQGDLNFKTLRDVSLGATSTGAMIAFIVVGATILANVVAFLGIAEGISQFVESLQLPPLLLIVAIVLLYLLLGCFLDGFSMIVMTLPIVLPIVIAAGFEPLWFGIFLVIVVEVSQITPPLGFNLFIIQGLTGEKILNIAGMTLPYLVILVFFALFIAIFPEYVLFLPEYLAKY